MPALDYAATRRNREPLLAVLKQHLPERGLLLEIASGSGQHHVFFAPHFPQLQFQPSDREAECLESIAAWQAKVPSSNLLAPVHLDLLQDWPVQRAAAVLAVNVIHISPWSCTLALMAGAGRVLEPGGKLLTYGPYKVGGQHTAASNLRFEGWLQGMDPAFGVRDVEAVEEAALAQGLHLVERVAMPANNSVLVFERR